jgi:hypothetical protein
MKTELILGFGSWARKLEFLVIDISHDLKRKKLTIRSITG